MLRSMLENTMRIFFSLDFKYGDVNHTIAIWNLISIVDMP